MAVPSKYIQSVVKAAKGRPKSTEWFRDKIKELGQPTAMQLIRDGKKAARPFYGNLNMFFYDPKTKVKLPYYDTFPLVLPLEGIRGGFMGMNFHYLPPLLRFRLLELMQRYATSPDLKSSTRMDVSYDRVAALPIVRPTIKKYLWSHVRSNFLRIDIQEAAIAVHLPVQQFKKRSAQYVWSQSRRRI